MKRINKILLIVFSIMLFLVLIDIFSIYVLNRPVFAIKSDGGYVYNGLLYNTYICPDDDIKIKLKNSKYNCSIETTSIGRVINIYDSSLDINDYACNEVLTSFYKDDNYTYYWECDKDKYMLVEYESGFTERVSEALKYGTINISDLDSYNINYIKYVN